MKKQRNTISVKGKKKERKGKEGIWTVGWTMMLNILRMTCQKIKIGEYYNQEHFIRFKKIICWLIWNEQAWESLSGICEEERNFVVSIIFWRSTQNMEENVKISDDSIVIFLELNLILCCADRSSFIFHHSPFTHHLKTILNFRISFALITDSIFSFSCLEISFSLIFSIVFRHVVYPLCWWMNILGVVRWAARYSLKSLFGDKQTLTKPYISRDLPNQRVSSFGKLICDPYDR
jgi:hypothetical protein